MFFVEATLVENAIYLYLEQLKRGDKKVLETHSIIHSFIRSMICHPCNTWGKYAILRGLSQLQDQGLLSIVSNEDLEILKTKTDYSDFIDKENLEMTLPTNYYHVAFSCAALREKLGWEKENYSEKILNRLSNNKQETKIRRTMNKCIECNQIVFDYLDSFVQNKLPFPKCGDIRKWFTIQKTIKDHEVIQKRNGMTKKEMIDNHLDTLFYDVSNDALKQEIKDTYNSFIRFFKKLSKYPVRKSYKSYRKGFYVDTCKIRFTDQKVRLEKISNSQKKNRQVLNMISLAERNRIPTNTSYYNPRVILEGDRFYIVVSVADEFAPKKKITPIPDKVIGIDLNIKAFVTSDNDRYVSITKTKAYKKNVRKLLRIQRSLSRMDLMNKTNKKHTKNYYKKNKIKRRYEKRKNNLKDSHISYIIEDIISKRPEKVIVETLDVKEMKENYNKKKEKRKQNPSIEIDPKEQKIAKGIQENPFSKFLKALEYRLYKAEIKFIKIDRWEPSSKTCHVCKYKKNDLKLSDRIFICPKCGLRIDRDYNAAINIRNYGLAM